MLTHFARRLSGLVFVPTLVVMGMLAGAPPDAGAQIVNMSADVVGLNTPVSVPLEAGTYRIDVVGIAGGGEFDAWNPFGATNCAIATGCPRTAPTTNTGFLTGYRVVSPAVIAVSVDDVPLASETSPPVVGSWFDESQAAFQVDSGLVFPDASAAAQNAPFATFELAESSVVEIALPDDNLVDNLGGLSIEIVSTSDSGGPDTINPFRPDRPWIFRTDAVGAEPAFDDFYQIMPTEGTAALRLFITVDGPGDAPNPGASGTPCRVGTTDGRDSDHICAFNVNFVIGGSGDAEFLAFTPNPEMATQGLMAVPATPDFDSGQTTFSLSFVNSTNPLDPGDGTVAGGGVREIGVLEISTFGSGATVEVLNGEAVRSSALFVIDLSDPNQSLSNLAGDTMQPHALAVSEIEPFNP